MQGGWGAQRGRAREAVAHEDDTRAQVGHGLHVAQAAVLRARQPTHRLLHIAPGGLRGVHATYSTASLDLYNTKQAVMGATNMAGASTPSCIGEQILSSKQASCKQASFRQAVAVSYRMRWPCPSNGLFLPSPQRLLWHLRSSQAPI